jgi:hypothetical protein
MTAEIIKLPYSVIRGVHSRKPRRLGAVANRPSHRTRHVRVLTGEKWEEIVAYLPREQQQAFMAEVWKLINRQFRKL